tara:strand:- start:17 stop:256 length:240 start_codon:yes stop_codon:yes gene_type:complete
MGKPADRDVNYMKKMWGTDSLITDYWSLPRNNQVDPEERMLSEVMHDDLNQQYKMPSDRYSKHCGGKDGFDDFVERWHE